MAIQNFLSDIKLGDSIYIRLGSRGPGDGGGDLNLYHNATNSFIDNHTGNVYIRNFSDDKNIHLQSDDGSGGVTDYIVVHGDENIVKFQQHSRHLDTKEARFGTGSDLKIFHDANNSYIQTTTGSAGDLYIKSQGTNHDLYLQAADDIFIRPQGGENGIKVIGDGAVELYHDNVKQLETNTNGVKIVNNLGIGVNPSSVYGIYQDFNVTDANIDNKFAYFIDADFSGADNTDGDREQGGIRIDIDSSADGDASDEHRLYGVWSDVRFTGYSDLVRAGYFYAENNMVTGSEQQQETVGVYASAVADGTNTNAGTNNLKAVQGQASVQNVGYVNAAYGGFFQSFLAGVRTADANNLVGVRGEVEIDSSSSITLTNARAMQAIIDVDNTTPTITNSYLLYGGYEGTTSSITNKYGIYLLGSDNINRLDGVTLFQDGTESAPSIARLADTDTGIYFPTTNQIALTTNGTNALTINASQHAIFGANIGLGNATSPNRLLHIDNTPNATKAAAYFYTNAVHTGVTTQSHFAIYSDNASSTGTLMFGRGDGSGYLLHLKNSNTDRLIISSTGFATFGAGASFAGDVTVGGNLTVNGTTTTINTATVEVEDNILQLNTTQGSPDTATAATSGISIYRGDGVTQASFIFDDADDTWDLTNNLKVEGKLGIGTGSSIDNKLHVEEQTGNTACYTTIEAASWDAGVQLKNGNGSWEILNDYTGLGTTGSLAFYGHGAYRMVIDNTGKVGVGTNSPASNLHVKTSVDNSVTQGLIIERSANSDRGYINYQGGGFQFRSTVGDPIVFGETDAEHVRIIPDGNVGIGHVSPPSPLTVGNYTSTHHQNHSSLPTVPGNHLVNLTPPSTTDYYGGGISWSEGTNTAASLGVYDAGSGGALGMYFATGNNTTLTERMRIDEAGNVGIGTASPSKRLHIYQTGNNQPLLVQTDDHVGIQVKGGNSHDRYVSFQQANGTVGSKIGWDHSSQVLKLNAVDTFASTHLAIDVNGKVGVGTDAPDAKLQVRQTAAATSTILSNGDYGIIIEGNDSGTAGESVGLHLSGKTVGTNPIRGVSLLAELQSTGNDHDLLFATSDAGAAPLERMRLTGDGKFGIGTNAPAQKLDISGHVSIRGTNKIYFNHDTNTARYIGASSANDLDIAADDDINYRTNYNRFFNGSTEFARLSGSSNSWIANDSNGKLGVGLNSPASTLHVLGPNAASGGITLTSSTSDNTQKVGRIKTSHYDTSEEPFTAILTNAQATDNVLRLGGGSGAENAATDIRFYTAANNTTLTGTERLHINESGNATFTGDVLAPIFYDSNNTNYFLNPAGTATSLKVAGSVGIGRSPVGKLTIEGDGSVDSNIFFQQSGSQEHRIYAATNNQYNTIGSSSPKWYWGQHQSSGSPTVKMSLVGDALTAGSFVKSGGTSSQFLKADGSVDSNTYLTSSSTQSKYLRSDAADTGTGTITLADNNTSDSPLILGSSAQTNYTLQQWRTSAHGENEAYILAYGAGHTSQAGNFAIKNIESGGEIFFELAGGVEPLRMTSTGATFAGNITVQGATTRLENNVTVGNSSGDYLEVRYNDTANYATKLMWKGLQFGNNGVNKIIAGRNSGNGYFDFYVNNTNDGLANTPNGSLALTLAANKDAAFKGNVTVYTGASTGALSVGRNSSERLEIHQSDTNTTLTAYNDIDENQEHNFILDRSFGGSGGNNFRIRKGGSNQLTIDKDAHATFAGGVIIAGDEDRITAEGGSMYLGGGNGNTTLVQFSGDAIPDSDSSKDLGSTNRYWRHAYIDAMTTTGNVTIGGNLYVTGTSTAVNVEDLNVEQGEITLNYAASSDTSSSADGSGIRIQDAVNATTDATILWDKTNSQFTFSHGAKVNNDLLIGDQAGSASTQAFGAFDQLRFDNSHSSSNVGPNKIVMHDNGGGWIGGFGIHSDTVSYYTGGYHRFYKTTSQTASTLLFESGSTKTEFYNDLEVGGLRIVHDNDSADQQTAWIRSNGNYIVINPVDGEHLYLNWDTGASGGSGHVYAAGAMYATVFYDRNDTTYYLDASNTGTSLKVAGKIESASAEVTGPVNGVTQYAKSYSSLDTTGQAVAGLVSSSNGASAMFVFETGGGNGSGGYQKVVYNCLNVSGTWSIHKDIDEGGNRFDVTASSGSTVTFTFKARSSTQNYSPKVIVKAIGGSAINTTYI